MKLRIIFALGFAFLLFSAVESALAQNSDDSWTTVTYDDNGKTITLQTNEYLLLDLGKGYDWTITVDNESVLKSIGNEGVVGDYEGLYKAHKSGEATITATGDPTCLKKRPPCLLPSLMFRLDVNVP